MDGGVPLGKVAGFPLSAHWSVLVIMWLFTWSLATTLPSITPGYPSALFWAAGGCGALALLACLLAHELTHAIVARRAGVEVLGVKLWLFGGIARLAGDAANPKSAFWIAASGPITSMILAAVFAGLATGARLLGVAAVIVAVGWWLAGINLLLAVFNLLPGAPLDGGRILRAYLWYRDGDPTRAAVGAARAGRIVAYVLIGLGLIELLAGAVVGGVWMAFIGWFLLMAARDEGATLLTRQYLAGVRVADVMSAHPRSVPDRISAEDFIQRYLLGDRHSSYPVEGADGGVTGLITLDQLRDIPPDRRATTRIGEVAVPRMQVVTARPDEALTALLDRLSPVGARRALVVDNGEVVGIVTASDITRAIDVHRLARSAP